MPATRTARERARAELTTEIKDEARRQLAKVGADRLSLRAVARELGMVSSALYRYFPSRDRLLTALIVDAYNAIGEAAGRADRPGTRPAGRWHRVWHAARSWAIEHPHEYALIYGSPIPGYHAPADTITPAARIGKLLTEIVARADPKPPELGRPVTGLLKSQAVALGTALGHDLEPVVVARLLIAWTQLFGAIGFELFGQYVGSAEPAEPLFSYTVEQFAAYVGIPPH